MSYLKKYIKKFGNDIKRRNFIKLLKIDEFYIIKTLNNLYNNVIDVIAIKKLVNPYY